MKIVAERDHVDRVLEQWANERPELDTTPVGVIARVGRLARYVDHALEETLGRYGLSRASWDVLASLRRSGAPYRLSPTELYRSLMRTSGAMTNRLYRLERAGLVRRIPDPSDGRGMLVALTPSGRQRVDEVAEHHLEGERRLLSTLSAQEQENLTGLLRKLLVSFESDQPVPPSPKRRGRASRRGTPGTAPGQRPR